MSEVKRLSGKTALVTGAGQGSGRAIALRFLGEGAQVIALDLNEAALATYHGMEGVVTVALDVGDAAAIEDCRAAHPDIDILVNCAGIVRHGTVLDCTPDDFAVTFRVNVEAMYHTIRAWLPGMRARGHGVIINIASALAANATAVNRFAYGASKGAVVALTKSVALDFIKDGIRCNSISPGTIQSPSLEGRIAATGDTDAAMKAFVARQPMGRLGQPEEVAAVALLMASGEAGFMTGSDVVIDGGFSL